MITNIHPIYEMPSSAYKTADEFNKKLILLIEKKNYNDLNYFLLEDQSLEIIKEFTYEVFITVTSILNNQQNKCDKELFKVCNKVLDFLSITCEPAELLLYIVEQIGNISVGYQYLHLLNPLKLCIIRSHRPLIMMHMSTECLTKFITCLDTPNNQSSCAVYNSTSETIILYLLQITHFLDNLLHAIEIKFRNNLDTFDKLKCLLLSFLINMFGKPFCYLNCNIKNCKYIFKKLLKCVKSIKYDIIFFFRFIKFGNLDKFLLVTSNKDKLVTCDYYTNIDDLSLSNFYWVVFQAIFKQRVLSIYNPHYLAFNCINLANFLFALKNKTNILIVKALEILKCAVNIVKIHPVSFDALDLSIHLELAKNVMKNLNTLKKKTKKYAIDIFVEYIYTFNDNAQYAIIKNLLTLDFDTNIISIVISIIKSLIVKTNNAQTNDCILYQNVILNENLELLIPKICKLKNGKDTDLLDIFDPLTIILNLILFIVIRDQEKSKTFKHFKQTKFEFFENVKCALICQKEEWSSRLNNLSKLESENQSSYSTIDCKYKCFPFISVEHEINVCNKAINMLYVIETILIRIYDLLSPWSGLDF